jgi:hypothetical protein
MAHARVRPNPVHPPLDHQRLGLVPDAAGAGIGLARILDPDRPNCPKVAVFEAPRVFHFSRDVVKDLLRLSITTANSNSNSKA